MAPSQSSARLPVGSTPTLVMYLVPTDEATHAVGPPNRDRRAMKDAPERRSASAAMPAGLAMGPSVPLGTLHWVSILTYFK